MGLLAGLPLRLAFTYCTCEICNMLAMLLLHDSWNIRKKHICLLLLRNISYSILYLYVIVNMWFRWFLDVISRCDASRSDLHSFINFQILMHTHNMHMYEKYAKLKLVTRGLNQTINVTHLGIQYIHMKPNKTLMKTASVFFIIIIFLGFKL